MSDRIKKIKIKQSDGTFSDYIPIGADAKNIDTTRGESVQSVIDKTARYYNSIAEMKLDNNIQVGDTCVTLGYYEANDGGSGTYKIVDDSSLEDDGGSIHELNNGLKAKLIIKDGQINVKQFGAKGNAENDDTQYIQNAINIFYNNIINNDLGENNTVIFPAGRYKITQTIILYSQIKMRTSGYVVFLSYVTDGNSCLYLTATEFDNDTIGNKQDWFRGPWIDGNSGLLIKNMNSKSTSTNFIGIEIGSKENLEESHPTSRYEVKNIRIYNFNIGLKMNNYNNYIVNFNNISFETNNIGVLFEKTSKTITVNSGEKISFNNCLLAGSTIAMQWNTDGFHIFCTHCSFDFCQCLFYDSNNSGYHHFVIDDCHIEGFGIKHGDENTIHGIFYGQMDRSKSVISNSTILNSADSLITLKNGGNQLLLINNRIENFIPSTPMDAQYEFLFKNAPIVYINNSSNVGDGERIPYADINLLQDYGFQKEEAGIFDASLTDRIIGPYTIDYHDNISYSSSFELCEPNLEEDPSYPLTTKWLKITPTSQSWDATSHFITDFISVNPGISHRVVAKALLKNNTSAGHTLTFYQYDINKQLISTSDSATHWPDSLKSEDIWLFHPYVKAVRLAGRTAYIKVKVTSQFKKETNGGGFGGIFVWYS